jgi:nucleoside-diphosphate-sugar epimerase
VRQIIKRIKMQTILGAGGAVGTELAKALLSYTKEIRLVSRNPSKVNDDDELFSADLTKAEEVKKAIEGSDVVYVTVGFEYKTAVWQERWPKFISNVIISCIEHNTKLVFFDNMYMYDPSKLNPMTEKTPINPSSKKGKVRAEIAKMIMDKVEEKKLTALIARSADFYGPGIKNTSMLTETVFKPFSSSKKANWMGSDHFKHSFTHIVDAAKGTALLGNTEDAFNQVWHLPTASNPMNGKELIETIAKEMGAKPKYRVVSISGLKFMGIFVPIMREMIEMMYQYDRDYVFDSSKFEKRFDYTPIPYLKGIQEIVKSDYQK